MDRTAVMAFNTAVTLNVGASPSKVIVARQATYPLWADDTIVQGNTTSTAFVFGHTTTWSLAGVYQNPGDQYTPVNLLSANPPYVNPTTTYPRIINASSTSLSTYGARQPVIGIDGDLPWVYVPAGSTVTWMLGTDAPPATETFWRITYQQWVRPGEVNNYPALTSSIPANSCSGYVTPFTSPGGWFRPVLINVTAGPPDLSPFTVTCVNASNPFTFSPSLSNQGTFAIGAPAVGPQTFLLPIAFPVEHLNSPLPWKSTRTTATSALFTNTTKALAKEGTALWARVAPQINNPWSITYGELNNTHPAEKRFMGLENGCYTYVAPTTDLQLFTDYDLLLPGYTGTTGSATVPVYRLDNTALLNVCYFSDPDGDTSLAVNCDWHLEFRTTSSLFEIAMSPVPLEALHQAQLLLAHAGFFYPNVSHVAVITALTSAWRFIRPYAMAGMRGAARSVARAILPPKPPVITPTTVQGVQRNNPRASTRRKRRPRSARPQRANNRRKPPPTPKKKPGGLSMYLAQRGR